MKIEKKNKLLEALAAWLLRVASVEDKRLIDDWIENSEENRQFLKTISDENLLGEKMKGYDERELRSAWSLMEIKINRLTRKESTKINIWRYVGAAACLVAVVTFAYMLLRTPNDVTMMAQDNVEYSSGAQLILPSGEIIPIGEEREDTIKDVHGMNILTDTKHLDYTKVERSGDTTEIFHELRMRNGMEYTMILSDGSKVFLNAESRMRYPVEFLKEKRVIEFEGEAYFEIVHNPERPFIIRCGELEVVVLGTEFNFRAYSDEPSISTTLVEGKVLVSKGDQHCIVQPGEQAVFEKESGEIVTKKVDIDLYTAWKNAKIMFRDTRLEDVMRNLSRWYSVKYEFLDDSIKHIEFGGCFDRYDSIEPILNMIRRTELVSVVKENDTVYISKRK